MDATILVSEFMDETAFAAVPEGVSVRYEPTLVNDRAALEAAVAWADALIVRNRTAVDRALLDAGPRLRAIGRLGVGLDNIDVAACQQRGIAVLPATGANTLAVAEYVIAAALMLTRGAYGSSEAVIAGSWPREALIGHEVSGRIMGLYGFGGIARAVAQRASALGMEAIAHDPFLPPDDPAWDGARRVDAAALLREADVLSLHLPLTDDTRGLIGAAALSAMKPGAVLINTARGGIVDEAALAQALREGRLSGGALDVYAAEPLGPDVGATFAGVPNLILTPHIAGVTVEANTRVSRVTLRNVLDVLRGT